MIKTYIINLETSVNRKEYMQALLAPYEFLDVQFIKAVDGRKLTAEQIDSQFDRERSYRRYGRELVPGEIGCCLSHRKCYESLLKSSSKYALVLEDDIAIIQDLRNINEVDIDCLLNVDKPRVLFLSGDYWRLGNGNIVPVFDANGAYAYIINRSAAKVILSIKPSHVADDWRVYKRRKLRLYAMFPYCIDANVDMDKLPSDVAQTNWGGNKRKMGIMDITVSIYYGLIERILKKIGLFVSKIRIIDNRIVEN